MVTRAITHSPVRESESNELGAKNSFDNELVQHDNNDMLTWKWECLTKYSNIPNNFTFSWPLKGFNSNSNRQYWYLSMYKVYNKELIEPTRPSGSSGEKDKRWHRKTVHDGKNCIDFLSAPSCLSFISLSSCLVLCVFTI